jgi:hypothetical protein
MANKKKAGPEDGTAGGETPREAAKAAAPAAGVTTAKAGAAHREKKPKTGKLVAKGKKRLPRKEKKRLKKAEAAKR